MPVFIALVCGTCEPDRATAGSFADGQRHAIEIAHDIGRAAFAGAVVAEHDFVAMLAQHLAAHSPSR